MDGAAQPNELTRPEDEGLPRARPRAAVALMLGGLLVVGLAASAAIVQFAEAERARELARWQARLDLVAATRAGAIEDWLGREVDDLDRLARNPSVRLYLTRRPPAEVDGGLVQRAQLGYLRNLIEVTAERLGYAAPAAGPAVGADVARPGTAGIALVDRAGARIAASAAMAPPDDALKRFLARAEPARPAIRDIGLDAAGRPEMAFAAPVFAVQGERRPADQLGWIVGVKPVGGALARRLRQPGETGSSASAMLVRREGQMLRYLWPADPDRGPLGRIRPFAEPGLAASWAVENPGGFAIRRDDRGTEVLIAARAIAGVPWTVAYKIDRAEALGAADSRAGRLLVVAFLALGALGLAFLAVWRHGASVRAAAAAERHARLSERFAAQSELLRLVSDAEPAALFILDETGTLRFANRAAADALGAVPDDVVGKRIDAVIGAALGERYRAFAREALAAGRPASAVQQRAPGAGGKRIVRTEWIPLEARLGLGAGVLVVESDITDVVTERERRERTLARTVDILVGILDRRDPYAAEHSARTARLAGAIADEMRLDAAERETAVTAARLMNVGKVLVPAELLARRAALAEPELRLIRDSVQLTADLLEPIAFDGPVVETLRQVGARYDGTGEPPGLAGEEILRPARIVAVANAFVAMTSARAWRGAADADAALDAVIADSGKAYDRAVLAALATYMENHGGRAALGAGGTEAPAAA